MPSKQNAMKPLSLLKQTYGPSKSHVSPTLGFTQDTTSAPVNNSKPEGDGMLKKINTFKSKEIGVTCPKESHVSSWVFPKHVPWDSSCLGGSNQEPQHKPQDTW